ncbi:methyltransferase [Novosphingobium sp. 9]|uniref:methyltransferase n=1 Tax=Novosphingobium sp. 9 TaxID=2025349 RepID=UPI0021B63D0F|nr:methyltransferase [Novosphingobium sp. 9]
MSPIPHEEVAHRFGAARDYDGNAHVQNRIAGALAARIAALDLPRPVRGLEIGCGTGFLTQALHERGIEGEWLVTDLAPEMVARCEARMAGSAAHHFAVLDGEREALEGGPFDLIVSSLAVQWFDDAPAALARLAAQLAPGGHLVVTTLGPKTFSHWRAAHEAQGLAPGTPAFAPVEAFRALGDITVETLSEDHADARAFLRAVKAIGAGHAASEHRPLSPRQLRAVMAQFEKSGACADYEVVTVHLQAGREQA